MKWLELHLDMNPAGIEPATELLSAYGIDSLKGILTPEA